LRDSTTNIEWFGNFEIILTASWQIKNHLILDPISI
jgi:hypothetical protein